MCPDVSRYPRRPTSGHIGTLPISYNVAMSLYITRRLPDPVVQRIPAELPWRMWPEALTPIPRPELLNSIADVKALVTLVSERIDAELLAAAPALRVVANMAVGVDNIDLEACRARGVIVTNTPDVLTETTADLAWALLLAASRRVVEGHKLIDSGGWGAWHPLFMTGQDVHGSVLGVVGAGRIGGAVLRRGRGFGMRLIYHNRRPSSDLESAIGAAFRSLDALLAESDHVVVCTPLTAETRGLIGARELGLMKPTSVFVNVSRGPVVDEAALIEALRAGRPWAAGLDVFAREPIAADHPLLTLPNVVATPHVGSASIATRVKMATLAVDNALAVLRGDPPLTPVG